MYPDELLTFSYSYLGKFIAIFFIIFATIVNVVYGTFLCAILILYYQSDMVEGMILYNGQPSIVKKPESNIISNKGEITEMKGFEVLDFIIDPPDPDLDIELENTGIDDNFSYTQKDLFRKKNCINGELTGNSQNGFPSNIKHEFADAVFPGLLFKYENRCNPCDVNCNFSIDEKQQYSLLHP
jgi:hypothetical protein